MRYRPSVSVPCLHEQAWLGTTLSVMEALRLHRGERRKPRIVVAILLLPAGHITRGVTRVEVIFLAFIIFLLFVTNLVFLIIRVYLER